MLLKDMSVNELENVLKDEKKKYDDFKKDGLKLDISRGKPSRDQLELVMPLLDEVTSDTKFPDGYRNYGMLEGISELKKIFADILETDPESIIIGGSSSLNLMYDQIQRCMQFGVLGGKPWNKYGKIKFLCPVPGYDRHFAITEHFGIEMIAVPMDEHGPIMDIVETLVKEDETIKGIWFVPKYSNPKGITYSYEVVDRLASMETKADDFRIFWDNAYVIHDLYDDKSDSLKNIFTALREFGNEDRAYVFTSTAKITFPGAGVSCIAASENNKKDILSHMQFQTICNNKIVQYMHALYLKDLDNTKYIMRRHAEISRPKFEAVLASLRCGLDGLGIADWTEPNGGYFISFNVLDGCAKKVWTLCKEAGLTITTAGATYPYGIDDRDANIRIAPTFTTSAELDVACELFVCCVKIACIEKLLFEKK